MKKLFWFFCTIVAVSLFVSCAHGDRNRTEKDMFISERIEYSALNIPKVSILQGYSITFLRDFDEVFLVGTVMLYRGDTVWLDIPTQNRQEQVVIKIANQEPYLIPAGAQVKIRANFWAEGHESGWVYTLSDDAYSKLNEGEKAELARKKNTRQAKMKEIPTGKETFQRLVDYIEEHGFVVTAGGVPCDRQVTFYDSRGNRHALITIKRDQNNKPALDGTVSQISVWAYVDGVKDQEHFFGYGIDSNTVFPFVLEMDGTWEHVDDVRFGFKEFLGKVESEST